MRQEHEALQSRSDERIAKAEYSGTNGCEGDARLNKNYEK